MKQFLLASVACFALASAAYATSINPTNPPPQGQSEQGGGMHGRNHGIEEAINKLPADKAKATRDALQQSREVNKAKFDQLRGIRQEMQTMMGATTFDKKAYMAKAKQAAELQSEIELKRAESMAGIAANLSTEERQSITGAFEDQRKENRERFFNNRGKNGNQPPQDKPKQ